MLADGGRGERLREGLVVAIAGPPNAGKSTLLNRIANREAAIVSPYAGTTRDVIEVHLDLGGLPVTLLDTAGIRETEDPVELEGVRRARERANSADLVLWVVEAGRGQLRPWLLDHWAKNRPSPRRSGLFLTRLTWCKGMNAEVKAMEGMNPAVRLTVRCRTWLRIGQRVQVNMDSVGVNRRSIFQPNPAKALTHCLSS